MSAAAFRPIKSTQAFVVRPVHCFHAGRLESHSFEIIHVSSNCCEKFNARINIYYKLSVALRSKNATSQWASISIQHYCTVCTVLFLFLVCSQKWRPMSTTYQVTSRISRFGLGHTQLESSAFDIIIINKIIHNLWQLYFSKAQVASVKY